MSENANIRTRFHCLVNWTGQRDPKPQGYDVWGSSSKPEKIALAALYEYLMDRSRASLHRSVLRTILHAGKHTKLQREGKYKYLATFEVEMGDHGFLSRNSYAIRLINMES